MIDPSIIGLELLAALILAILYGGWLTHRPVGWLRSVVKTAAVGVLALIALQMFAPFALTLGLALGAVGDWFLSRHGQRAFLLGLVAFALAHIAYIALIVDVAGGFAVPWGLPALVLIVLAAAMAVVLFRKAGDLRWPVMAYIAIITGMGLASLGLPPSAALGKVAAGAFILSDALLATQLFLMRPNHGAREHHAMSVGVWTLYWAAQLLFLATFSLMWMT